MSQICLQDRWVRLGSLVPVVIVVTLDSPEFRVLQEALVKSDLRVQLETLAQKDPLVREVLMDPLDLEDRRVLLEVLDPRVAKDPTVRLDQLGL